MTLARLRQTVRLACLGATTGPGCSSLWLRSEGSMLPAVRWSTSGVDDTTSGSSDSPPEDQKRAASGASASASVPTADIESLIPKLEWEPPRYYAYPPTHAPWTPTSQLKKRKNYFKRSAHIIQCLEAEYKNKLESSLPYEVPDFKTGDYLRLTLDDGSTPRPEIAKVLVIGRRNRGPRSSFICLRAYGEEVWHEIYPIYCPEIKKIEVIGTMNEKIRTAKKYHFWRDKKMGVAQLGLDAKSDAKQQQALHARQRAAEKNKARLDAKGR